MKKLAFILLFLLSSFLSSHANQDSKQDSLWNVANQYLQEQQYEKAANLYKELGDKIDTDYKEINSHKVKDLRKTYSIDELQLANNQQQNHLLLLALIILPCLIIVAGICFLYLKRQAKKLMLSKRKLQKAEKAVENSIRNKSLFISNMSHEIRTPLNALSGFSDVLTTPGIDEETRKQCNDIIQLNSHLLLNLVNDVVDISCLDVTNMKFNLKQCNAVDLCEGIVQTLEGIKQTQAEIFFKTALTSLEIETDTFTKEGSITLQLEQNEKGMAQFSITDTGCGIPLEKQSRIFERFERVNEKSQGTGLGLAICQLIISRLGGKIWIDPQYTDGSRFVFTHPLKQEARA